MRLPPSLVKSRHFAPQSDLDYLRRSCQHLTHFRFVVNSSATVGLGILRARS
jgi:hypothetical protein